MGDLGMEFGGKGRGWREERRGEASWPAAATRGGERKRLDGGAGIAPMSPNSDGLTKDRWNSRENWLVILPLEALAASFRFFLLALQRRCRACSVDPNICANRLTRLTVGYVC